MASYIKVFESGNVVPYTLTQLMFDNPQVSFPKPIPDGLLAEYDVYPVVPTNIPQVDYTKSVVEGTPTLVGGSWVQVWEVVDASPKEISNRLAEKSDEIRRERSRLLSESDWIIVFHTEKGTSIPVEWEVYRQELRDITDQAGFPFDVTWPAKP